MNKLRPLSALERKILAKLGETPSEHQAQVSNILNKTYVKAHDTKQNVHLLNKQVEAKLTYSEPSSDIASKLQAKENAQEEWIPDAYVIFIRKFRCLCGNSGSCLDLPSVFLRHRRARQRTTGDQENGPAKLYLPVKILANTKLQKLKEVRFSALTHCDQCFDKEGEVKECHSRSSPQAPTESCGFVDMKVLVSQSEKNSSSPPKFPAVSTSQEEGIEKYVLPLEQKKSPCGLAEFE